jgi:hypothetical protein
MAFQVGLVRMRDSVKRISAEKLVPSELAGQRGAAGDNCVVAVDAGGEVAVLHPGVADGAGTRR